jgi:hypothetical protein
MPFTQAGPVSNVPYREPPLSTPATRNVRAMAALVAEIGKAAEV